MNFSDLVLESAAVLHFRNKPGHRLEKSHWIGSRPDKGTRGEDRLLIAAAVRGTA